MQLRDKRYCWLFEKTFVLLKKLSFWPFEVALPFMQWSCTQFLSWCLVCWAGSERFASAQYSSCDLDDSVVWTSLFRSERTLPCWRSLEVFRDLKNLRCNAGRNTLCGFGAMYAFFLMTSLWDDFWQTFQCATNFWVGFSWLGRQKLSDKVRL